MQSWLRDSTLELLTWRPLKLLPGLCLAQENGRFLADLISMTVILSASMLFSSLKCTCKQEHLY